MLTHVADLIKGSWRYATGLRAFLSTTVDRDQAVQMLSDQLANREESFLRILELGIYGNPRSPYRRLLLHAGFEFEDVRMLVRKHGLEVALSRLHDAGVYVTLDEFKGRRPICREGLELAVSDRDFDNPLLTAHYTAGTGGSRGGSSRVPIDFENFAYEAATMLCKIKARGLADNRPYALWRPEPPATIGLRSVFLFTRIGHVPVHWYSSARVAWNRQGLQGRVLMLYTLLASRLFGRPLPRAHYVKDETSMVRFLADATQRGTPAILLAGPSQWVRLCRAAEKAGLDISGTAFYGGGEPYTDGKAAIIERAGCTALTGYGMQEAGTVGAACGAPAAADDMHFALDRLAMLQRPIEVAPGATVQSLVYTGLLPSASKLMLNVESGDYAEVEERDCGCLLQQMGFKLHIHHVRSYEKLTSESAMFMGSMLFELLDETLPARFGGGPSDYQLLEEEDEGLTKVSILVSPRVGEVDEAAILETVVKALSFSDWSRRMAASWLDASTLRVQRREPITTGAGKILPLHVLSPKPTRKEETPAAAASASQEGD